MTRYALALALASLVAVGGRAVGADAAQDAACLHGPSEKPDQRARRLAALKFATQLTQLEALSKAQLERFYQMEALPGLPPIPRGFKAQMTTDGASYAFSLKDTLDPCRFAYFSDQDGVVYAATPVP